MNTLWPGVLMCVPWLASASFAADTPAPVGGSPERIEITRLLITSESGSLNGRSEVVYRDEIGKKLRDLGFSVPATNPLFDQTPTPETRLQIGGEVVGGECADRRSTGSKWCELAVRWELFDVDHQAVIYRFTSRGQVEVEGATYRSGRAFGLALDVCVQHLATQAHFVDAVRSPGQITAGSALPDPVTDPEETSWIDRYERENDVIATRRMVGGVGVSVSVVGLLIVNGTTVRYHRSGFVATPERWRQMQTVNAVGWALTIGGLSVPFITPAVFPTGGGAKLEGKW